MKRYLLLSICSILLLSCSEPRTVRRKTAKKPFALRMARISDGTPVGGLYSFRPRIPRGHGLRLLELYIDGKKTGSTKLGPWYFEHDFLSHKNGKKIQVAMVAESRAGVRAAVTNTLIIRNIDFRIIVRVPENTPQDEAIYIAGNRKELGMKDDQEWDPRAVRMQKIGKNLWEKRIKVGDQAVLEFEFTRSSWATKGKKKSGKVLHCKVWVKGTSETRHVVDNWGQITGTSGPKGPTLHFGARSDREMTVFWEGKEAAPSRVVFGRTPARLNQKAGSGKLKKRHTVRLRQLSPATRYYYRVAGQTNVGSFTTALPSGSRKPFTFVTVGDFHGIDKVTDRIIQEKDISFVLNTGDMTYNGFSHSTWNQYFGLIRDIGRVLPFMTVPGNHEDESPLYPLFHPQPGRRSFYTFDYGSVRFYMINSERDFAPDSVQYRWLQAALKRGAAEKQIRWRIAAFHTPAYSTGKHLSDRMLQRHLVPLFQKHGVNLALSGHDHAYQITKPLKDGVISPQGITYIVSGGAGGKLSRFKLKADWIAFRKKVHHYCLYRVHPDRIEHIVRGIDGKTLYRTVLRK